VTLQSQGNVEPEAPPVAGVECNPAQIPSSCYELFGAKNKIKNELQQPLSKLIKSVNCT
jgi:hypothetical protein